MAALALVVHTREMPASTNLHQLQPSSTSILAGFPFTALLPLRSFAGDDWRCTQTRALFSLAVGVDDDVDVVVVVGQYHGVSLGYHL